MADPCPTGSLSFSLGNCRADGTRDVTLTANIATIPPPPVVAQWDFGDGNVGLAFSIPQPGVYSNSHRYATPSNHVARLLWVLHYCPDPVWRINVITDVCPVLCPPPGAYDVLIRNTNPAAAQCANGKREVWFNGDIFTGPRPEMYGWDFGDGSGIVGPFPFPHPGDPTATPPVPPWPGARPESHLYPAPGSPSHITEYHAKFIAYDFGLQCKQEYEQIIKVPGCGAEEETTGCKWLRWSVVIAAIMAALAGYMCLCVTFENPTVGEAICWTALGLALAAVVLFLAWQFWSDCPKPCGWGLLIAWQIALGTGIGAGYFRLCPGCGWLKWVALGLLVGAAIAFEEWIRRCRVPRCKVAAELGIVIAVIIVPLVGWLETFEFLFPCLDPVVSVAVGLLGLGVSIALVNCASSTPEPQGPNM